MSFDKVELTLPRITDDILVFMDCKGSTANGLVQTKSSYLSTINIFVTGDVQPSMQIFGLYTAKGASMSLTCSANINGVNIPVAQFSNAVLTSSVAQCTTHTSAIAYVGTGLSYALTSNALFKTLYYFYDLLVSLMPSPLAA